MTKRMIVMLLAVAVFFGGIFGYKFYQTKAMGGFASFRPPPVTVSAAYAKSASWNEHLTSIGTLGARYGVEVSAEVEGVVNAIRFTSGEEVEKGELLLELDDTVEQADLRSFEAQLKLARLNYDRDKKLIEKKLTSQDQYDRSQSQLEESIARVEQTRATIAKKKIRAPFSGRIGILRVDPGQYLSPGTPIASLQSLKTLHLDFSVPAQFLPRLFVGQTVNFQVDAYPGQMFSAELAALDSRVNSATRNLSVRAHVDNADRLLVPGMFSSVRLVLEPPQQVVVLPATAVSYSLYGEEVFVVDEVAGNDAAGKENGKTLTVTRTSVKTGMQQGDQVAILEGVEAGQLVVTDGQLKLQNGAEIALANAADLDKAGNP